MKTAYVKVILGFFSGRSITTLESKDRQWEDDEEKSSNVHAENKDCNKYSLDSDE